VNELPHLEPGLPIVRRLVFIALAATISLFVAHRFSSCVRAQTSPSTMVGSGQEAGGNGAKAVKYASDFMWIAAPSEDLSSPGRKIVRLASCPGGVVGSERYYYIFIAGSGIPEAAPVTGGSCAGDTKPGTLIVTTANTHRAGYTVSSATSGIQEASIAARVSHISSCTRRLP
jgi:hypothetical protein